MGLIAFLAGRAAYELIGFARQLPQLLAGMSGAMEALERYVYRFITAAPVDMQAGLQQIVDGIVDQSMEIPSSLYRSLLNLLTDWVGAAPSVILFVATYGIGTFFISNSYGEVRSFLVRQIPERWRGNARDMKLLYWGNDCVPN